MIYKPEQASYKLFGIIILSVAFTCLILIFAMLKVITFDANGGGIIGMKWEYIKVCLNPFDQAYCGQIRAAMTPASSGVFYQTYILLASAIVSLIGLVGYLVWDWGLRVKRLYIKAGLTVAGQKELVEAANREIKNNQKGLHWFAGFYLSRMREVTHFLIYGAIGGGKTQTIMPLLRSVMNRSDKAIIFDYKGDYTRMAYSIPKGTKQREKPILIAPHDQRSAIWDIAKDLMVEEDAIEVANRIIPDSRDRFFSDSARTVLALCIIKLMHEKKQKWTWWDVMETTQLPLPELIEAAKRFHRDAVNYLNADYRQVAATISTMSAGLGSVRMLAYGWRESENAIKFSLREWLLDENTKHRTVVLQRSGRFQDQSEGWISAFLTVMSANVSDVSFGEDKERRVWLFLDEFAQLPKIHRFESMLETGRSKGIAVVLGIQGLEQLVTKYSQQMADQLEALVGTKVIAKINIGQTARRLEEQFGETLMIKHREEGTPSGRLKWVRSETREPVIQRSEFQTQLGPLHSKKGIYVIVSGIGKYLYKVVVPYSKNVDIQEPEVAAEWTTKLREIFNDKEAMQKQADMTEMERRRFSESGGYGDDEWVETELSGVQQSNAPSPPER